MTASTSREAGDAERRGAMKNCARRSSPPAPRARAAAGGGRVVNHEGKNTWLRCRWSGCANSQPDPMGPPAVVGASVRPVPHPSGGPLLRAGALARRPSRWTVKKKLVCHWSVSALLDPRAGPSLAKGGRREKRDRVVVVAGHLND